MSSLKRIAIVTTGGTIAASASTQTTLGDYQVDQSAQQLIRAVPELEQLAHIEVHEVCHIDSRNMTFVLQHQLITQVQHVIARDDIDGVVITHGTDTLEETALLLQWCLKSTKPVVMTGAMRPASALSADGALNLFNAVLVASHPEAHGVGVLVLLNDTLHSARFVQKTHTSVPDAFSSPAMGPVGLVSQGNVYINALPCRPFGVQSTLHLPAQPQLPQVDIVMDYVGAQPSLYKACAQGGSRAVVIATLGNGSLSPAAREGALYCYEHHVVCVRASRILNGAVSPSEQDAQFHTLPAHQLHAVAARTLVALALAQQASRDELAYYLRYY
ncbi:MAG TPA: asparaginase [Paenalcaligenes hominis]|uniref:Asparaginase n=1 Tax=Paenalcaligenes hominis TaxID=643674 RepID=A0A9D3AAV5_9BURK|nr:asparaginase [Paenalcaligenes hominis]NJB65490.1 L-asparaginase [Paenalcaligenes hominis]GGE65437.1 L-asparaginase 2 [Paenalcaligenes hominis]HJH23840.1 asparaginase [Paenalcaligenes hominis]